PLGQSDFYVYRIAFVNEDGYIHDWSWLQIKEFCARNRLKHVPELDILKKKDLYEDALLNIKFSDRYSNCPPLSKDSPCDEGFCIRIEGLEPQIYKCKSPLFYEHETKLLDKEIEIAS